MTGTPWTHHPARHEPSPDWWRHDESSYVPMPRTSPRLLLHGRTPLEPALRRAARRAGVEVSRHPAGGPALELPGIESAVGVPAGADLARALMRRVLGTLLTAVTPAPAWLEAFVLIPAAGVCGPSGTGPIDAVRLDGHTIVRQDGVEMFLHLLTAQQTRCWLITCVLAPGEAPPSLRPDSPIEVLAPEVCGDTARLTQYLHDRDEGADWPGPLVLGPPATGPDNRLWLHLACTERPLAEDLIREALAQGDDE